MRDEKQRIGAMQMIRTNNPVLDAEAYQQELETAAQKNLMHCAECGEVIFPTDDHYKFEECVMCCDCVLEHKVVC